MTSMEGKLQRALHKAEGEHEVQKEDMTRMQAGLVLGNMYVQRTQKQLNTAEEKSKKSRKRHLLQDGRAKYYTGDEFWEACVEDEQCQETEAEEKQRGQERREARAVELEQWKEQNDEIRARNKVRKDKWENDVKLWEAERDCAKALRKRPRWNKPKLGNERLLPRPTCTEEGDGEEVEDEPKDEEEDELDSDLDDDDR
ncbi:hypothetical protein BDN72DRAFT_781204 [Pluteus cervinus]|uniref:Uncharacterized protein n=1 Tax=Pluteus cervinus TaxID=181527 RepID=A0ACD3A0C4_9AGAR|nr:hypothetical protein BDN72DRAFT_781204 [Pluteus cervinus]